MQPYDPYAPPPGPANQPAQPYGYGGTPAPPVEHSAPPPGGFSARTISILQRTAPSMRIVATFFLTIAIITWIGALFMIVGGVAKPSPIAMAPALASILSGFLLFVPARRLYKSAGAINRLASSQNGADLLQALDSLRSFWVFMGVMSIIYIVLLAIGLAASS